MRRERTVSHDNAAGNPLTAGATNRVCDSTEGGVGVYWLESGFQNCNGQYYLQSTRRGLRCICLQPLPLPYFRSAVLTLSSPLPQRSSARSLPPAGIPFLPLRFRPSIRSPLTPTPPLPD